MVGSWYLTHVTKNASWIFMLPFFVFVLQRKTQGSCISKHENKRYAKSMLDEMHGEEMTYAKCNAWNDKWQMQERYVHYNAMKRCLCDAWYECIYGHESPKNHLFLLAHSGVQCPMCAVKKVIWTFRLLVTTDETNIQCMRDDVMQMRNRGMYTAWQYPQIITQQRRTWHLGYMHGNV